MRNEPLKLYEIDLEALKNERFVTLSTDKGEIKLELFPDEAPQAVANFLELIKSGFYDGLNFSQGDTKLRDPRWMSTR